MRATRAEMLRALAQLTRATKELAEAQSAEAAIAVEKVEAETALVASLVGQTNVLTGKLHSATSAREAIETHERMIELRRKRAKAGARVTLAEGAYEGAKLWARYVANAAGVVENNAIVGDAAQQSLTFVEAHS